MDRRRLDKKLSILRTPSSLREFAVADRSEVEEQLGQRLVSGALDGSNVVAASSDLTEIYPMVDDIPILLLPERLSTRGCTDREDLLESPAFAEAYSEMEYYNSTANKATASVRDTWEFELLNSLLVHRDSVEPFPGPSWLNAKYDLVSQHDAYRALGVVEGLTVMQCGGKGLHALKLLIAGARQALLLTPMLGEAQFARSLAGELGMADRLTAAVGVAEYLPVATGSLDRIFAGSSAHHFYFPKAAPELHRCLGVGGRFAANDPYRAPLHTAGTKILGKREPGVACKPIDKARLESFCEFFEGDSYSRLSGVFFRYPLLALQKAGIEFSQQRMQRLSDIDDRVASLTRTRRFGSSVAITGTK